MNFNVLKHFHLSIKMTVMGDLQEIAEHLNPKFVSGVRFKDDGGHIMTKRLNNLNEMFSSLFLLHGRQIKRPDDSIRRLTATLYVDILFAETWCL